MSLEPDTMVSSRLNITDFEEDILKGKLNGEDLGDINQSWFFAKDLDQAIFETMKEDIREKVERELDATDSNYWPNNRCCNSCT